MSAVAEKIKFKKTGIEWMPEIPEHWEIVRLKNVVHGAINGVWGNEPQNNKNDIICVRVTDIDEWQYGINPSDLTLRNISEEDQSGRLLSYGDLLIEKSGGGEISPVGRVVIFNLNVKAVTSNFMARLNVNGNINKEFLYYYFRFLYHRRLNHPAIKATTGIQNLDLYSYLQNPLPLPPKDEQDEIVQYIKAKEEKINLFIQKKQRFIELLKEQRQSVISKSVTKGINEGVKLKDTGIDWIGKIPIKWEVRRLKRVSKSIQTGSTPKSENSEIHIEGGDVNWFTPGDIKDLFINNSIRKISQQAIDDGVVTLFPAKSVLVIGIGGTLGKVSMIKVEGGSNQQINSVTFNEEVLPEFGLYYLSAFEIILKSISNAATLPILTQSDLKDMLFILPPIEEQKQIVEHIKTETATIDAAIAKAEREIELIREYKEAMISEAVMGKIVVSD